MTTLLSDPTVRLRAPEPNDLDCMYLWENDPTLWPFGSTSAPMSRHQLSDYIDNYDGDIFVTKQLRLIVELCATGEAVGTVDITHFDPRDRHARIGVMIAPGLRRKGLGRQAVEMAVEYARDELGIHTLIALVAVDNEPSRNLFTSAGFNTCGRVRSYLRRGRSYQDIFIFQLLL